MIQKTLTLGSLFDGSGGFPLGGILAGIEAGKHEYSSDCRIRSGVSESDKTKTKHMPRDRCFFGLWLYFSRRLSILHPRTREMRYRASALALLMSLFRCSYIWIERSVTPERLASSACVQP